MISVQFFQHEAERQLHIPKHNNMMNQNWWANHTFPHIYKEN